MILDLYFATPQLLWAIPFILLLGAVIIRSKSQRTGSLPLQGFSSFA